MPLCVLVNCVSGFFQAIKRPIILASGLLLTLLSQHSFTADVDRWQYNMTEGVTPVSRDVYGLHMDIFWWCVAIAVVVFGVMFYTMIVHRKANGAKASNFHESTLLEIMWTVVPFIILIIWINISIFKMEQER